MGGQTDKDTTRSAVCLLAHLERITVAHHVTRRRAALDVKTEGEGNKSYSFLSSSGTCNGRLQGERRGMGFSQGSMACSVLEGSLRGGVAWQQQINNEFGNVGGRYFGRE